MTSRKSLSYHDAGVNIDAGNQLVDRIKNAVGKTKRPEVMGGLGGFGALCAIPKKYHEPILVSGTDGVGTKLRLAMDLNCHNLIGIDLVAMCVNDLIVQGAEPLFFLDYYATGKLNVDIAETVVNSIANGCQQSGCALVGGETAEMPGMYHGDDYDLAGFCVGVVEKSKIIDGSHVKDGDVIIALASSGAHSNGYSLIRKIIELNHIDPKEELVNGALLSDLLLAPTRIYVKSILSLLEQYKVNAIVHITGGGFWENIPRVLNPNMQAIINESSWVWPDIFHWLQSKGNVTKHEMYRTFNCGIGMMLIVDKCQSPSILQHFAKSGEKAWLVGEIKAATSSEQVIIR